MSARCSKALSRWPPPADADRAAWPGLSAVIVALDGYPCLGSRRWRKEAFEQETVRVMGGY